MGTFSPAVGHYLWAEFGLALAMICAAVLALGGVRLRSYIKRDGHTLADRESAFLARQSLGCRDNSASGTPHPAGAAALPVGLCCMGYGVRESCRDCSEFLAQFGSSDPATPDASAVRRPLYSLQGYTPARIHDDGNTAVPADRFSRGLA